MDVRPGAASEALEEVIGQLRLEIAYQTRANLWIYYCHGSSAQINRCHSQRLIHRHEEISGAENAFAVSQGLVKCLTQGNPYILDAMMLVDIEVAVAA